MAASPKNNSLQDAIHDLGGKPGYGPVDVDEPEVPFHHDWEGREWGISRSAAAPDLTIDGWRYTRELIDPEDYINRPYFDSWAQTDFATFINAGVISIDEVVSGQAASAQKGNQPPQVLTLEQVIRSDRASACRFDAEIDARPLFAIGDRVITVEPRTAGHTRLPGYAGQKRGIVCARHGAHVFPDLSARGIESRQHLYTVEFASAELWPEAAGSIDKNYLDLWESYLTKDTT